MSPVRDGLRDRPERKLIIMENYYAALNYTDTLQNDNDHIMVKIQLHCEKESVTINPMIDSGATEDFIDREVCNKHGIKMIKAKNPKEIYLVEGEPSAIGPVTHMTKVPMDISSHRELATFQVANLQNHEVILGMPWLREHNPTIDWNDKRITFNSEQCTTWCLKSSPVAYAVPKEKPWKKLSLPDSPRSRPRMARWPVTRASELRSYPLRPKCLGREQEEQQDTTCTQSNEPTFLPEGKQLLGQE